MNRLTLSDPELKVLLDQVMNSRTALYGALQDSIVDADLLLSGKRLKTIICIFLVAYLFFLAYE